MLTVSNEVYIPRFRLSETRGIDAAENISQSNRSRYHLKAEKSWLKISHSVASLVEFKNSGTRGRYVSIQDQTETTWWDELTEAWKIEMPNVIFQGIHNLQTFVNLAL